MTDPITAIMVLGFVASKVAESLIQKGVDISVDTSILKIKGSVAQQVFQKALADAIRRYSTYGSRFSLGELLLGEDSPLAQDDVAKEISYILRFDREPDYQLIGDRWKSAIQDPPSWRDFTFEAQILARFIREELQGTEVFGPVFDSKNLNAINTSLDSSAKTLVNIEQDLKSLIMLMNSQFGNLMRIFSGVTPGINENIRDFSWYIEEKTRDFVGRKFVFDFVEKFYKETPRGYIFVRGDPGIGKTAFAAEFVKQTGCVHHFNSRPHGINSSEAFLKNICSQIIAAFHLNYSFLPPYSTQDSQFLMRLLYEASERLAAGEKVIIFIDALDEVDDTEGSHGANILYLPPTLPNGVYIIATSRKTDIHLRVECEQRTLFIKQDEQDNLKDIGDYISSKLVNQGIQNYVNSQSISNEVFTQYMITKSQGNFMYLRYVLPEIELGYYKDLRLEALPEGLINYYEDHWHGMRVQSENAWLEYKLPILIALSIVKEPVSIDLISEFSQIKDLRRINAVLHEWQQFLYDRKFENGNGLQKRWRVYHDSFREFIASKDEVEGEHVSLKDAHGKIVGALQKESFGKNNNE